MLFLARLAFKNLFRHRLRTVVSIGAIAFSVMVVVFARGYVTGLVDSVTSDHIQYDSGHIKVVQEEYLRQQRLLPLNYPVDGVGEVIVKLQAIDDVAMVIPRLKFGAMVSTGDELVTLSGWGVNPDQELAFTNI
ncbi:MAG: ABC transporter permease, partial [Firmicutes bacterium]|nr:ABC transporter permease [Bacillota bacterium]